jgi:hypothetical protein
MSPFVQRGEIIMAFLEGGHPELSTCEGCFPSGCPPTKMAIIVLFFEQRTKSDTFMTTV